ncbi:MAG: ATP-binding cassette domain-containing protein [Muribaculaceae bacterium]|nr:ATP-binding cassette domain-containing protein [Muribaculaceae bacterium]
MTKRIIEYNGVTIERGGTAVLSDVTITVREGEMAYLTGRVGSGKTTLLKTLYAQLPIAQGEAHMLDYDLTAIRQRDIPYLRRRLGIVFQDFQLLMDRNVYDNLKFVLKATGWQGEDVMAQRIEWALTQVDMVNKAYEMPHRLSGGEQQRIAIARALLNTPQLIIADEPTGNLDQATSREIMTLLKSIAASGTAVLMATHNRTLIDAFPATEYRCEAHTVKKVATNA